MKEAVGAKAEKAKREKGIKLMIKDDDFVWSLYSCKNRCNQEKKCEAFSFDEENLVCYLVIPKPEAVVEKINFDDIFEKSREGVCDTSAT